MRRNPLVDELTPEAKAELAAMFADMKKRLDATWGRSARDVKPWRQNRYWERRGW